MTTRCHKQGWVSPEGVMYPREGVGNVLAVPEAYPMSHVWRGWVHVTYPVMHVMLPLPHPRG